MKTKNVLFILFDGLRKDYLHYSKELEKFSKNSVFFSNMNTASPYTIASFFSFFSGIYPTKNGVNSYYNMFKFKKGLCRTLPEYLKAEGFATIMDAMAPEHIPPGFDASTHQDRKKHTIERHIELIKRAKKEPNFFLFLHYANIHRDLIKNVAEKYDDFSEEYFNSPDKNKLNYISSIKDIDGYVESILDYLRESCLDRDTMVVMMSDHGVSLGERKGERMYGSFLFNYTLKVFCMIKVPGTGPVEFDQQVRTIDVLPTILDILKIKEDKSFERIQGRSLLPFINKTEQKDRIAFSETGGIAGPWPSLDKHNVFSISDGVFKLVFYETPGKYELFNQIEDKSEINNLFEVKGFEKEKNNLLKLLEKQMKENEAGKIF